MMKINKLFDKTFLKFLLVGVINTLFGSSIMFISYNALKCNYWVSTMLNYILGSILSYFLNKYFTFNYKEKSLKVLLKFILNIAICYFIGYGLAKKIVLLALTSSSKTIRDNISMVVGVALFTILNFIGQRFFAFKKNKE